MSERMWPLFAVAMCGCPKTWDVDQTFTDGTLIDRVQIDEDPVCNGAEEEVRVTTSHPTDPSVPIDVWVNSGPGTPHILHLFTPGPDRPVLVYARSADGLEDHREFALTVDECPLPTIALSRANPYRRYTVDLAMQDPRERPAPQTATYTWDFGDGQTATTDAPYATHDYSTAMDHTRRFSTFQVTVLRDADGTLTGARHTVSLYSAPWASRSMGFLQADVVVTGEPVEPGEALSYELRNPNDEYINFTRVLMQLLPCDPEVQGSWSQVEPELFFTPNAIDVPSTGTGTNTTLPGPGPGPARPPIELVGPNGDTEQAGTWRVFLPANGAIAGRADPAGAELDPDECGVGYRLIGTSETGMPAYASFYVKTRRNPLLERGVSDVTTAQTLQQLIDLGLLPDDRPITTVDLDDLRFRGVVERTPEGWRMAP